MIVCVFHSPRRVRGHSVVLAQARIAPVVLVVTTRSPSSRSRATHCVFVGGSMSRLALVGPDALGQTASLRDGLTTSGTQLYDGETAFVACRASDSSTDYTNALVLGKALADYGTRYVKVLLLVLAAAVDPEKRRNLGRYWDLVGVNPITVNGIDCTLLVAVSLMCYKKVVLLSSDAHVRRNIDELGDLDAPDFAWKWVFPPSMESQARPLETLYADIAVMPTAKTIGQLPAELASYLTTHGLDGPWAVFGRYALTARRGVTHIHGKCVAYSRVFTAPDRAVVIGHRALESPDAREWQQTCDAACA